MENKPKLIAIVGPTASGKTSLSVNLAKRIDAEIISADSRLVYKDFNIGTAKPTELEMSGIPHHMIDVVCPSADYSACEYTDGAELAIKNIYSENKTPIVTGGTGFYVKALLGGLDIPKVEADNDFRFQMENIAKENGNGHLHNLLAQKDPLMAQKLHPNDKFRVIRALEVIHILGIPMSEAQKIKEAQYDILYIGLNSRNRDFLYERINKRVDIMLENGLLEEVKTLINKYGKTVSILKTLGYKEICEYLEDRLTFDEAIELIKKNTRNFAKRQLTWFRANNNIHWLYIDEMVEDELLREIVRLQNA